MGSSRTQTQQLMASIRVGALALLLILAPDLARAQSATSLIRDTEIEEILRANADPVLIAAGLNPKDVRIHLIGDKQINAFVSGGQQMFFNTGLITQTRTPNELIGVMAHETGHISGGHLARSGDASKAATGTFVMTLGLGLLAALAGAPDAAAMPSPSRPRTFAIPTYLLACA
jgi:predicted Zn-dependent protease